MEWTWALFRKMRLEEIGARLDQHEFMTLNPKYKAMGKFVLMRQETYDRLLVAYSSINQPLTELSVQAIVNEAAHQRARWGEAHDKAKSDADWFWLVGYLGGKALHNPGKFATPRLRRDKKRHRIIAMAAAAVNWLHYRGEKS